jgi:hypothetical protein
MRAQVGERHAESAAERLRGDTNDSITALQTGDRRAAVDRRRQNEALIVVGVVAEQLHPAWCVSAGAIHGRTVWQKFAPP